MKSDLCSECNNPVIVENVLLMATKYMESGMLSIVVAYVLKCLIKGLVCRMNR